jgi:type I restriction enzyme M protein
VRICVEICDPKEGMSVYDPTVGSGGMLIQARDYLRECGADAAELSLNGQEKMGTTWSICKMNMLLHGISHADIRNADTLADPRHKDENNELRRFDRVLANPPFSQNYAKTKSKDDGSGAKKKEPIAYPGRFHVWMPEKGRKADLMFVQHMLAVLKNDGRMATVMPHGVLFRGGEEREARQYFIDHGYLEAVIALPVNLFYGTGIPACILVLNKAGARERDHVLFINADREYREGKAQNHLRPEDIDKIVNAYRAGDKISGYAELVPVAKIQTEDYNCNIRRYVDNAPPPEPHDVRAHIHGGVPVPEIDTLGRFWRNYEGLRESCFINRTEVVHGTLYADFAPDLKAKRAIAQHVSTHPGVTERHARFMTQLEAWWQKHLPVVEALAPDADNQHGTQRNVYQMRSTLLDSIQRTFAEQHLLNSYQVRGAFANYYKLLASDFKSIAASGWGPELIPDDDILQSQFPQVLAELEQQHARLAELQALFLSASEEDFDDSDDSGVLPADEVKTLKASLKEAKGLVKLAKRDTSFGDPNSYRLEAERIEKQLARHKALEDEAKALKAAIKSTEAKKDDLVEQARLKISKDEARLIIVERLGQVLFDSYRQYLRADESACCAAIANLWGKYAANVKQIEAERNKASETLQAFLVELGYE